ncbi:hypothetical protein [Pasteurella multocida]|nr:hypothetical protein [Pasteurella multocida]
MMIEKINIMLLPILNLENFNQYNNGKIILEQDDQTQTRKILSK